MIVSFYRAASDDIASYIEYLLDEFAYSAAERFPIALEEAVAFVVTHPGAGPMIMPSALRSWPLPGFPKVQLYYRCPSPHELTVVRVLHSARDIPTILDAR